MAAPPAAQGQPIEHPRQLVEYLEAGCKPRGDWRMPSDGSAAAWLKDLGKVPTAE